MDRVPTLLLALGLTACASAPPPSARVALDIVQREAGPDLAARTQPSNGVVELSVFIDAGARDAEPPQVAAVAAQLAAERAGEGVTGRVWPEGSELTLRCNTREVVACTLRLARGLSARAPSKAEVERLVARLSEARRAAAAADPGRQAERLALHALLGDHAAGLFPLGEARDDASVDAARVGAFLAAHYGPQRALLVSAGELSIEQLSAASTHAFKRSPRASDQRGGRPTLEGEPRVLAEVDARDSLAIALLAPNLQRASAVAAAVRARLRQQRLAREVRGHVFPLRGGAVALLRVDTGQPSRALRASGHELARIRIEGEPQLAPKSADDGLGALLHQAGLRWLVRGEVGASDLLELGGGVTVTGARADRTREEDPDDARRSAVTERMRAALDSGREAAEPELLGEHDAESARVSLHNGTRIHVVARSGERVAIAVRFEGGSAEEPPLLHGRAALLAMATATACAGRGPGALEERLTEIGASLEPRVDADSWGLLLTAPAERALAATQLAMDCAIDPWLARRHVTTARSRARTRLGGREGPRELRARVAEVLAPEHPGALAPWGSVDGVANASLDAVRDLAHRTQRGSGLSVGLVGPVEADTMAAMIARRAALLPARGDGRPTRSGSPAVPSAREPGGPPAEVLQPSFGLLLWRVETPRAHPAGAKAFAALMRDGLSRIPGVSTPWHDAGVTPSGGWAAVAVVGSPETVAALRTGLHPASNAIDRGRLAEASARAFARYEATRAVRSGRAGGEAEALARAPFLAPGEGASDAQAARALAEALAGSEAHFLPLR